MRLWWRYLRDTMLRSVAFRVFLVTYSAYAILYATRKPFSVVKTLVQDELKLSTYSLGLIDTAFLGSYALGQIFIPAVLTKLPLSQPTLLLCLYAGSGAVATLFGLSSSAATLTTLWLMNGLLHSAVFPLLLSVVSPAFSSEKRGQIMGAWTTSQQTGATAATLFAAYSSEHLGWRSVFILPGIFTLIFGFLLRMSLSNLPSSAESSPRKPLMPPPPGVGEVEMIQRNEASNSITAPATHHSKGSGNALQNAETSDDADSSRDLESGVPSVTRDTNSNESRDPKDDPGGGWSLVDLLKIRDIKAVSMAYFCVKCIRYSLLFWLPYYLATELEYDHDVAGYASIMFDMGGIFGGILTGQFADRVCHGRRLMVASVACVSSAVALLLFAATSHYSSVIALGLMGLVGFTVSGSDSIIGGSATSDLCDRAGISGPLLSAAAGIVNGFGSVGAVLQGYLTAHISETYGWGPLFLTLAIISVTGVACLVLPVLHESGIYMTTRSSWAGPFVYPGRAPMGPASNSVMLTS